MVNKYSHWFVRCLFVLMLLILAIPFASDARRETSLLCNSSDNLTALSSLDFAIDSAGNSLYASAQYQNAYGETFQLSIYTTSDGKDQAQTRFNTYVYGDGRQSNGTKICLQIIDLDTAANLQKQWNPSDSSGDTGRTTSSASTLLSMGVSIINKGRNVSSDQYAVYFLIDPSLTKNDYDAYYFVGTSKSTIVANVSVVKGSGNTYKSGKVVAEIYTANKNNTCSGERKWKKTIGVGSTEKTTQKKVNCLVITGQADNSYYTLSGTWTAS